MGISKTSLQHPNTPLSMNAVDRIHGRIWETSRVRTYPHKLHGDQFESFFFEPFDYLADQTALNAVWLDHDESAFGIGVSGHDSLAKGTEKKNIRNKWLFLYGVRCPTEWSIRGEDKWIYSERGKWGRWPRSKINKSPLNRDRRRGKTYPDVKKKRSTFCFCWRQQRVST